MKILPLVFFSGGTALKDISVELAQRKISSGHIITTFDSGGSSGTLRQAFSMPAVGDIRSRLLALANRSDPEIRVVCNLLQHRLSLSLSEKEALEEVHSIISGRSKLCELNNSYKIPAVQSSLASLLPKLPRNFSLTGASIGNLVLTEAYLTNKRSLSAAIDFFSSLVEPFGEVVGVAETPAHLAVRLQDSTTITGQHLFTGKNNSVITSPIIDIWLCKGMEDDSPISVSASDHALELIEKASCLCFPIGSFFSSLIANLLPHGICSAINNAKCPKIFIPNPNNDPELVDQDINLQLSILQNRVGANVMSHILIDRSCMYLSQSLINNCKSAGIKVIKGDFLNKKLGKGYVSTQVVDLLVSL